MFYVGQKVVCVAPGRLNNAVVGRVYTVAGWSSKKGLQRDGTLVRGLLLKETKTPYLGFDPFRFRPVVERKTDISIFTDMLTPKTEQVSA